MISRHFIQIILVVCSLIGVVMVLPGQESFSVPLKPQRLPTLSVCDTGFVRSRLPARLAVAIGGQFRRSCWSLCFGGETASTDVASVSRGALVHGWLNRQVSKSSSDTNLCHSGEFR